MRSVGGNWRGVGRWQNAAAFAVRYDFRSRRRAECASPVPSARRGLRVEASIPHEDADSSGHSEHRFRARAKRSRWLSRCTVPQLV